jgi:hypothetical protein
MSMAAEDDDIQDIISRTSLSSLQIGGKPMGEALKRTQPKRKKSSSASSASNSALSSNSDPSLRKVKVKASDTLEGLAVKYCTTVCQASLSLAPDTSFHHHHHHHHRRSTTPFNVVVLIV